MKRHATRSSDGQPTAFAIRPAWCLASSSDFVTRTTSGPVSGTGYAVRKPLIDDWGVFRQRNAI